MERGIPKFRTHHKNALIEFSYLKAFLAWEKYLEEAFIHFLLGAPPLAGRTPRRLIEPAGRSTAIALVNEGREFVDWTSVDTVVGRAERYFKGGNPFNRIRVYSGTFNNMKTLRNALVHSSISSVERYKSLVRNELSTFPRNLKIGQFLDTVVPTGSIYRRLMLPGYGPTTYLEFYLAILETAGNNLVN